MSITYNITTNFGAKDSLNTGDSNKVVRGSEFTTEFTAIKTALALAAPAASPTFTGTLTFGSISDGAITVTAFVDEDDMASNSATLIPTQQSVKAYVDSQITANNELSEVLSNGNTTGGSNISFGDNDKAVFGAGNDLQIFHDGSGSFISDTGTGDLHIRASNTLRLQNSAGQLYAFGFNGGEFALYHNNAQKLATTSTGIDVTGVITTDGMTTSGNINFMDNDKAIFGGSSDLQIYHSGTESRIDESGPGNLKINADNLEFYNSASTEAKAKFNTNGSVQLYHDNAQKLVTTSTGIDVTGAVTADSLSNLIFVDSANNHVGINTNSPASLLHVYHATDDTILKIESGDGQSRIDLIDSGGTARLNSVGSDLRLEADPTNSVSNSTIDFKVDGTEAMRISAGGDISFFEDTGTTAKFFFDASAEALILGGNFSSSDKFEIRASSGQESGIRLANNASSDFRIFNNGSNALQFNIGTSTAAMLMDSSGNVGIGTTSPEQELHVYNASVTADVRVQGSGGTDKMDLFHRSTEQGLFGTGAVPMTFGTNSAERMRIDSSGKVGIGTTSPARALDIVGSNGDQFRVSNTTADATLKNAYHSVRHYTNAEQDFIWSLAQSSDSQNTLYLGGSTSLGNAATAIRFYTAANTTTTSGLERMRIDSDGNVGIGTTSPTRLLHVRDASSQTVAIFDGGANSAGEIGFRANGTSGDTYVTIGAVANDMVLSAGANERMRINSSGNVGIGTSSPARPLTVNGLIGSRNSTTGFGASDGFDIGVGGSDAYLVQRENANIIIETNGAERMRITSDGNVGIGTANPQSKLQVDGTFTATGNIFLHEATASSSNAVEIGRNRTVDGAVFLDLTTSTTEGDFNFRLNRGSGTNGALQLRNRGTGAMEFLTNDSEAMRIDSSGNVGIGTNSPDALLEVAGTTNDALFNLTGAGTNFELRATSGNGATANSSVYRLALDYLNGTNTNGFIDFYRGSAGDDGYLAFGSTGTERMRIDSSGNVGIGVTSVGTKLDISTEANKAGLRVTAPNTTNQSFGGTISAGTSASDYAFNVNSAANADLFRIRGDGNVGIGTASPANQLDVVSTSNATARIEGGANGDASLKLTESGNSGVQLKYDGTNNLFVIGGGTSGSFTTHMALTRDGGSVGIGTDSPGANLQIHDTNSAKLWITADGSNPTNAGSLRFAETQTGGNYFEFLHNGSTNTLTLTSTNGDIATFDRINQRVGIGTNSPSTDALHVVASGLNDDDDTIVLGANFSSASTLGSIGTHHEDVNNGGLKFSRKQSGTLAEAMRIDAAGNLLVGTTSDGGIGHTLKPSGQLRMKGSGTTGFQIVQFSNDNGQVGNITTSGTGTTYNTSSDQRLKDNIVDAPSASDDIDAIQVRSFDWKADGSHQKYGMVAQELLSVAPEAVSQGETEEDMMGVDYSKLVPMMMKEIQSLRARVAQLEGVN